MQGMHRMMGMMMKMMEQCGAMMASRPVEKEEKQTK
jgi:hypothetical protein